MIESRPRPEDFRFSSPEVSACPFPFYDAVRGQCPVYRLPGENSVLLSTYQDVREAARRWDLFSSHRPIPSSSDPEFEAIAAQGYPSVPALVTLDPPEHTRVRKLVGRSFSARVIAGFEDEIRAAINQFIDGFGSGAVEFMAEFALPFPIRIIGKAFGVPIEDQVHFQRWADAIADSVSMYTTRERALECRRSIVEMQHYFAALVEQRRSDPGDDLVSAFVGVRVDDERPLALAEILELVRIFLAGGSETTSSLLGSGLYLLLTHPEQMEAVQANFGLIPQMLEESLRFQTPVQWNPRIVERDGVEVAGQPIPKGSRVLLGWGSANRDPDKLGPDADRFDIFRTQIEHMAFGHGVHFCPGAGLARLEAKLAFEVLFTRLRNIRLAVDPADVRYAGPFTRRIERLPLTFELA